MNIFQSGFDATFYSAIMTIAFTLLSDVVKRNWNRRAKELNEILDLDSKLSQKNPSIRELAKLYEARFVIQAETIQEYKKNRYLMSGAPIRKVWLFHALKAITFAVKIVYIIINYLVFDLIANSLIQHGFAFPVALVVAALVTALTLTWSIRFERNVIMPHGKYRVQLQDSSNDPKCKEFDVKIPKDILSFAHYAFIGIPEFKNLNKIRVYKLVSSSSSNQPVIYKHAYTRDMSVLEREWMTKLNKLGGVFRKSSFYVPLVKESSGLTYSAYYLVED